MVRQIALVVALAVVGCGRIGFEPLQSTDGGAPAPVDASRAPDGAVAPDASAASDAGGGEGCSPELAGNAPYAAGSGASADPFQICSPAQLAALATRPEDLDAAFVLAADLDLAGVAFPGLGGADAPFVGVIDGNGHTIRNLTVTGTAGSAAGLINVGRGVFVRDLTLETVRIDAEGSSGVGALFGVCDRSQARDVVVRDAVVRGGGSVGGLMGDESECQVIGATLGVEVTATGDDVGGVVGSAARGIFLAIDATVDVSAPASAEVGGVVGLDGWSPVIIQSVFVRGSVVGDTDVGGIVGFNGDGSRVYRSRFEGTVRGDASVGGFVGGNYDSPFLFYSTSVAADVTGRSGVGGFSGYHYYRSRFYDCYYTGTLTGVGADQAGFGGFFGDVEYYGWIERSYTDVIIDSQASTAGGFVGRIGYWSASSDVYDIVDSFSVANVTGASAADTLSLYVGENLDPNPLVGAGSVYWSGGSCTNRGAGGCGGGGVGIADRAQLEGPGAAPLSRWDFAEVWRASAGSLPTLRTASLHAPTVSLACPAHAIVGRPYRCALTITDADPNETQPAIFAPGHTCAWLVPDVGQLEGTPTAAGSCTAQLSVTDGTHETGPETFTVDVHDGVVVTPSLGGAGSFLGFVDAGTSVVVELTLTNDEPVPATGVSIAGLPAGPFTFDGGSFPGTGGTCGGTLDPAESCTVAVRFAPTAAGDFSEVVSILFTAARGPVHYPYTLSGSGR